MKTNKDQINHLNQSKNKITQWETLLKHLRRREHFSDTKIKYFRWIAEIKKIIKRFCSSSRKINVYKESRNASLMLSESSYKCLFELDRDSFLRDLDFFESEWRLREAVITDKTCRPNRAIIQETQVVLLSSNQVLISPLQLLCKQNYIDEISINLNL